MKNKINLVSLHKSRISGASQCDEFKILSHCFAPSATKSKILSLCPSIAVIYAIISIISVASVSATSNITHQTTINPEFTINDSISVSLSSPNLVISDLTPGQSSDSNEITVTVSSNNVYGYTLKSTVGNAEDYNTDALVHTNGSNTGIFSNLTTTGTLSAGEWGYAYATYNPTTEAWNSYSSYAALPIYTNTGVGLIDESENGSTSIKFKIGAYATVNQVAGEYNNIVNFTATGNPEPAKTLDQITYMQDTFSCADTTIGTTNTLIDNRDGKNYTVAKLADGKCWMTQNLAIEPGTEMTSANTNINSIYTKTNPYTLPGAGYDLRDNASSSNDNCYGTYSDGYIGSGWSNACSHMADSTDIIASGSQYNATQLGAWYNYPAATAGTINTQGPNSTNAEYDICPYGWGLPSNADFMGIIDNYSSLFTPLYGGYYMRGSLMSANSIGRWWSSTASSARVRRYLNYENSNLSRNVGDRHVGYYVRCIYKT